MALFKVIRLTDGKNGVDHTDGSGRVALFESGEDAAGVAREMSRDTGERYQVRPYRAESDWREREQLRFDIGTYKPLPFVNESWFAESDYARTHFAHISQADAQKVSFTANEINGVRDIQTRMLVGRYLTRYFESIGPYEIRRWSTYMQGGVLPFKIARTRDEIRAIYTTSSAAPDSCMRYQFSRLPAHPSAVYEGDLGVAYIENEDGTPCCRALVWPDQRQYLRIYGLDESWEQKLKRALDDSGYESVQAFDGAKGTRIPYNGTIIMPYLDYSLTFDDDGKNIVFRLYGTYSCHSSDHTDGIAYECYGYDGEDNGTRCDRCDSRIDEDDNSYSVGNETWCDSCYENHTFSCEHCDETYSHADGYSEVYILGYRGNADYQTWCHDCRRNDAFTCDATSDYWSDRYQVELRDGRLVNSAWFEDNGFTCEECHANFETTESDEDCSPYCRDCRATLATHKEDGERRIRVLLRTSVLSPLVRYRPSPTQFHPNQLEFEFTFSLVRNWWTQVPFEPSLDAPQIALGAVSTDAPSFAVETLESALQRSPLVTG